MINLHPIFPLTFLEQIMIWASNNYHGGAWREEHTGWCHDDMIIECNGRAVSHLPEPHLSVRSVLCCDLGSYFTQSTSPLSLFVPGYKWLVIAGSADPGRGPHWFPPHPDSPHIIGCPGLTVKIYTEPLFIETFHLLIIIIIASFLPLSLDSVDSLSAQTTVFNSFAQSRIKFLTSKRTAIRTIKHFC